MRSYYIFLIVRVMDKKASPDCKNFKNNIIVAGVISAQVVDSAGEILNVKNADISSLNDGTGYINCEHLNPTDIDKAKNPDFAGFNTIVGRVISCKKIFGPEDCDDKYQKAAWEDLKVPLLWGVLEFWDDIEAHSNARAAASLIRLSFKHGFEPMIGFSVEGSVLDREGIELKHTVIRAVAATLKPANKVASIKQMIKDDFSPECIEKSESTISKKVNLNQCVIITIEDKIKQSISNLKKTLEAGSCNSAPGSLTQGASLQKESSDLNKILAAIANQPINKKTIKKAIPTIDDNKIDKLIQVLKTARFKKDEEKYTKIYQNLFKSQI